LENVNPNQYVDVVVKGFISHSEGLDSIPTSFRTKNYKNWYSQLPCIKGTKLWLWRTINCAACHPPIFCCVGPLKTDP